MIKAFWEGFREGVLQGGKYCIPLALALAAGWALGSYLHPYEQCTRKGFTDPVAIGECIWLLENQPALYLQQRKN